MIEGARYDIDFWQVHETEQDCTVAIRSTCGQIFYCYICPSQFLQSPTVAKQYFKCLELFRSGEEEIDDFDEQDAYDWLLAAFEPVILPLTASSDPCVVKRPTLAQYIFPQQAYNCALVAVDDELQPRQLDTSLGWGSPIVKVDKNRLAELDQWTRTYAPSDVQLCYDRPEETLIRPPGRVIVKGRDGQPVDCFYKMFRGEQTARKELDVLKQIVLAQIPPPPETYICRLHGVVRNEIGLLGMLFIRIDQKCVLSKPQAATSSAELRQRWASQISRTLDKLHNNGIIWGDAKASNILIDKNDDAWIIDFGGSYTPGWVDEDKSRTLEGDKQGFAKIMDILN
ncbi:hypothetical protein NM208_g4584 [Fusarium decemcellulare]|uniref:Uncharacterized protein n=1 Tax=Fusarium decemcellulare TaxID=57161 RepID=A0ACC1SKL4_9HYPO|nr:hypothetical protein NM208_g4584 [Fusarium decemcellulare]